MKWRKLFRTLHRDTGYLVTALTIAYVISGIAVNHIADWNPSYKFRDDAVNVGPLPTGSYKQMEQHVVAALRLDPKKVKGHFMETDTEFRVFLEDSQEVRVDVRTGEGRMKRVVKRPLFYEVNALHLNNLKGVWTWIADLFALALLLLVITGVFMMKGERGLGGRGKWFVAAGTVIPVLFVLHLYLGCSDGLRAPPYSESTENFTLLARERAHRTSHLEGGDFTLTSHYRKTAAGIELCRVAIAGKYTQGKKVKRSYRLDVFAVPAGGLSPGAHALAAGKTQLALELDATEAMRFDGGTLRIKTARTERSDKGFTVIRALGGTIDAQRQGKRYLGSFFVKGGIARIDGQCEPPAPTRRAKDAAGMPQLGGE